MTLDELNIKITGNATRATNSINKLTTALEKLKQLGSVATSLSGFSDKLENASPKATKFSNSIKKIGDTSKTTSSNFDNMSLKLAKNITKWAIIIRTLKRVADVAKQCFEESNAYIESLNLFTISMGSSYKEALSYAEKVRDTMGIDDKDWMNYQGKFQNLVTGFGVAQKSATTMSQTLTQMAYDLSSYFNVDVDTAFKKLQSGMSGQIKGLKEYGINLSVAALQEYAMSQGITTKVSAMTEAERSFLRYNLILERTSKIQGDMARTLYTPANAMRILQAQSVQLQRALGNLISVMAVKFIPYIQAFIKALTWAVQQVAKLFGFELPKIDYSGISQGTETVSNGVSNVGDSANNANKSVNTLKENLLQLAGFDEINILKSPTKDTSTSGAGTGTSTPTVGGALGGLEDNVETYDFLGDLDTTQIDKLTEKYKEIFQKIINIVKFTIKWKKEIFLVGKILVGLWAVGKVVKFITYLRTLGAFFKTLGIYKYLIEPFKLGWATAIDGENKFSQGLNSVRGNLTTFQKGAITAFTSIAAGIASFDFVKDLVKGTLEWKKALLDIVVVAGAIGIAFALTGPVGGIITIVGAAIGAFAGLCKGIDASAQAAAEASLSYQVASKQIEIASGYINQAKTAIDSLQQSTNTYISKLSEIQLGSDLILQIEQLNSKTKLSSAEIEVLKSKITTLNSLNLPGIKVEFDETTGKVKQTNEELEKMRKNMIKNAKTAALQEVLTSYYKTQYEQAFNLSKINGELTTATNNQTEAQKKLNAAWNDFAKDNGQGKTIYDFSKLKDYLVAKKELKQSTEALNKLNEAGKKSAEAFDTAGKGIQFYQNEIDKMSKNTAIAGKDVDTGFANGIVNNQDIVKNAIGIMSKNSWDSFHNGVWEFGSPSKKAYESGVGVNQGFSNGIDKSISLSIKSIKKLSKETYNTFEKSLKGMPKTNSITKAMDNISNVAKQTFNSKKWGGYVSTVKNTFNSFSSKEIIDKIKSIKNKSDDVFKKSVWNKYYKNIKEINNASFTSLKNKFTDLKSKANSAFKYSTWKKYGKNVSKGLKSGIDLPQIKMQITTDDKIKLNKNQKKILKTAGINVNTLPIINWKAYAQGGFPDMGDMFIANERAPEMVGKIGNRTAVVNNEQIVQAVSQGVYDAVTSAMGVNKDGKDININIVSEIDGNAVGKASVKYHNGVVTQKGKTPLLGVN